MNLKLKMDFLDMVNLQITQINLKKSFFKFFSRFTVEFLNKFNNFVKNKKFNVEKLFLSPNVLTHTTFFTSYLHGSFNS
jgi:hypothetical protein